MIRQGIVEIKFAKPQPVEPFRQSSHQLTFRGNVFEEEDEHELHDDDGVFGGVAVLAVVPGHYGPEKRKIQNFTEPSISIVPADTLLERE